MNLIRGVDTADVHHLHAVVVAPESDDTYACGGNGFQGADNVVLGIIFVVSVGVGDAVVQALCIDKDIVCPSLYGCVFHQDSVVSIDAYLTLIVDGDLCEVFHLVLFVADGLQGKGL